MNVVPDSRRFFCLPTDIRHQVIKERSEDVFWKVLYKHGGDLV